MKSLSRKRAGTELQTHNCSQASESGRATIEPLTQSEITSNQLSMRYLPKSPADREAMLKAIGARSIDDLFAPIPAEYRLNRDLKVPRQMAESEIVDWFRERARENGDGYATFLGRWRLLSLPAGDHRLADFPRRISHRVHALSGRNFPRHAAIHLRIPDDDLRTDRHGSGQRLDV